MAGNRFPCFLIGLGIGTAFGLLVAPKGGDETAADSRRGDKQGRDFVIRSSGALPKVADKGIETVDAQRRHVESALEAGMQAYREAAGGHW